MTQINFKQEILTAADGEEIIGFLFEGFRNNYYREKAPGDIPDDWIGKLITWEQAAPYCDYSHDNSYGSQECHSVYFWTASEVFTVHEYDGATWIESHPRNPISLSPPSD